MLDKLKIGLLDFLTILVPGGFLLLLLGNVIIDLVRKLGIDYRQYQDHWIVPVIAAVLAYILGHFVFFFASFLDELIYEKVKRVYWHSHSKLAAYVVQIKNSKTGITDPKVMNAWKWSCAWLLSTQPEIYAEVERNTAESKFFRSLVVVLIVAAVVFVLNMGWQSLWITIPLIFFSLIRYLTQRQRSLETAYHGVITSSNEVLPNEPDPAILATFTKKLLYPNENLYARVKKNDDDPDRSTRTDKFFYEVLKFFYTIGLCIIPGFSKIMRSQQSRARRKKSKLERENATKGFTLS